MTLFTLQDLLLRLSLFLDGKDAFSIIRDWVYDFYEAEESYKLDEALEEVFPALLAYLQYDETKKDSQRETRLRRIYKLLKTASSSYAERTVFGLEYDEIRELTRKLLNKLITEEIYQGKMAELSPAPYNVIRVIGWANVHVYENDPIPERLN